MSDFSNFKAEFKGDLVVPSDTGYAEAIARWAINSQRRAEIVAFVKDATDVALAIKYARNNKLQIAIRGGGHSPAGASSAEGGLVIDLSKYLNGVKVDAEKKLAYVGGGALWETVDKNAIQHDLATVGGTVNHTGVGGLLLGGGYGFLTPAHGLVIDNLVQATIVTADGSALTANETENSDLFFGIRGGGSNFGVATEFILQLHPQRRTVYAGMLVFAQTALEKITNATLDWWPNSGEKESMLQLTTVGPDGNPVIILFIFYNGTEAEGRANFKRFLDIGPTVDRTGELPYEELNAMQNPNAGHGRGVYMKGLAHREPRLESISRAFDRAIDIVKSTNFNVAVLYEYFPLTKIQEVSTRKTAFRRDPAPSVLIMISWKENTDENNDRARGFGHELVAIFSKDLSELTASQGLGYSNYDPEAVTGEKEEVPDKAKLVFADNYPRLQQIKKQYDPDNIFNKWFPITPA